jgi:hypothetical protein
MEIARTKLISFGSRSSLAGVEEGCWASLGAWGSCSKSAAWEVWLLALGLGVLWVIHFCLVGWMGWISGERRVRFSGDVPESWVLSGMIFYMKHNIYYSLMCLFIYFYRLRLGGYNDKHFRFIEIFWVGTKFGYEKRWF